MRLDDEEHARSILGEIEHVREALGRSSKLRDLFDYLIERSRNGAPPREIEIAQDVFGRSAQTGDDGGARVYIHRLRRRLEEIYGERPGADIRIALPLGEYRLVAEMGFDPPEHPIEPPASPPAPSVRPVPAPDGMPRRVPWGYVAAGAGIGLVLGLMTALALLLRTPGDGKSAAQARRSAPWAALLANQRSILIVEGDHYLFAEQPEQGGGPRLVRDYRIRSREDLDAYLLAHPQEAGRYADVGQSYIPTMVPRAQQYLSPILHVSPGVRVLPASQLPAAAMLSQNIVYLGLASGLGPMRAPVTAGSRFALAPDSDMIRDLRTGRTYGGPSDGTARDGSAPRRQYGLVSLFAGKEGNRYIVLAGTTGMALVGLVETLSDPQRLAELSAATHDADTAEALYAVDSQGAGILAARLVLANGRDQRRVWTP